jgi:hypothetical protein
LGPLLDVQIAAFIARRVGDIPMRAKRRSSPASTYLTLIVLIVGGGYAVEIAKADHSDHSGDVVISADEKAAFLAYVKRQNMRPASSIDHASVGDVLPGFGVTYYALPLRYGHPFYRCVSIGAQIVIVDRSSGVVIQILG